MKYSKKKLLLFLFIICVDVSLFADQPMPATNAEILQAAQEGNLQAFKELIRHKKNVNVTDEHGNTPLHIAAKKGHAKLIWLLIKYDVPQGYCDAIWQWLFGSKSPDINAQNNDGDTATHCAVECDDAEGLVNLILKNPDLLIKNKKKYTALLLAADKNKKEQTLYLMYKGSENYYKHTVDGNNILHIAINKGHYDLAKEIISENSQTHSCDATLSGDNALIKAQNNSEETPLLRCAQLNNDEITNILLQNGAAAVINVPDKKKYMPISYACYNNNFAMIKSFIEYKAAANKSTIADAMPIHIAFNKNNYSLVAHLKNLGVDINGQEILQGNTPLHVATENNDRTKIEWLMKNGADITRSNKQGMDAPDIAIKKQNKDLLHFYSAYGIAIDRVDADGRTRLLNAFDTGNNDMIEPLLALHADINRTDKEGNTGLHLATKAHNVEGAKKALRHNKNLIFTKNIFGDTPLHYAADDTKSFDFVSLFIDCNAQVNSQNNAGEAPLHRAAAAGNNRNIQILKNNKALLSLVTKKNNTSAHYALLNDKYESLPFLLDTHMINIFNNDGQSILSLAIEKKLSRNMMQKIIEYGVDLNVLLPKTNGNSYLHHAISYYNHEAFETVATPALLNKKNNDHVTPLSWAVQHGNRWAVQFLCNKRVNLNVSDINGWTEMHHAAARNDDYMFTLLPYSELAYTKRTNKGDTPLHIAAWYNRLDNAKKIVGKDKNLSRKNDAGETPMMKAAYSGSLETMKFLLQPTDFIDGTVDTILQKIPAYSFSSVRMFLEKKVQHISNECSDIIATQNMIKALLQINKTNHIILKEKAIEEGYYYTNTYSPTSSFEEYTFEQLKRKLPGERERCRKAIAAILQKEEKDHDILEKKLQECEEQRKEKLKKQREKEEQEQVQRIAKELAEQKQEVAEPIEQECDICNEMKKDAQHRCVCEQCDKKICLSCVQTWQGQGKSTCPYCFNALKKD